MHLDEVIVGSTGRQVHAVVASQQDQWRIELMSTGTELVKYDRSEPNWNALEVIAGKLGLTNTRTRPPAPLILSTYLVGYPVQVEARGDPERLSVFVDRLGRLSGRSDRSQLRIRQTDGWGS